jgi:formylmethanofuran dehydrogenase subunit E-like metal-binding protein
MVLLPEAWVTITDIQFKTFGFPAFKLFTSLTFDFERTWNLYFLSNVIIIKTKGFLPQTQMALADFGYYVF